MFAPNRSTGKSSDNRPDAFSTPACDQAGGGTSITPFPPRSGVTISPCGISHAFLPNLDLAAALEAFEVMPTNVALLLLT